MPRDAGGLSRSSPLPIKRLPDAACPIASGMRLRRASRTENSASQRPSVPPLGAPPQGRARGAVFLTLSQQSLFAIVEFDVA